MNGKLNQNIIEFIQFKKAVRRIYQQIRTFSHVFVIFRYVNLYIIYIGVDYL
jgi:hypothetical protein